MTLAEIVGLAIGVVGAAVGIISLYNSFKSRQRTELTYTVSSLGPLLSVEDTIDRHALEIRYKNKDVENLQRAEVTIRNSGNKDIEFDPAQRYGTLEVNFGEAASLLESPKVMKLGNDVPTVEAESQPVDSKGVLLGTNLLKPGEAISVSALIASSEGHRVEPAVRRELRDVTVRKAEQEPAFPQTWTVSWTDLSRAALLTAFVQVLLSVVVSITFENLSLSNLLAFDNVVQTIFVPAYAVFLVPQLVRWISRRRLRKGQAES